MIPSQWTVIGSSILTIVLAGVGATDNVYHTHYLTNPITLVVLMILGMIGIHQTKYPTNKKS